MLNKRKNIMIIMLAFIVAMTFSFIPTGAAPNKPAKVKGVKTTSVSTNAVTLKWKKAKLAKKYKVAYRTSGKWIFKTTKSTKLRIRGLKPGKKYAFKVKSYRGKKSAKWSKTVYRVTKKKATVKNTITVQSAGKTPDTPKSLTVTRTSEGIKVVAGAVSGAEGYIFYRNSNGETKQVSKQSSNTFIDKYAYTSKWYAYSVKAYNAVGTSGEKGNYNYVEGNATPGQSDGGNIKPAENYIQTTGGRVYPSADGTFTVTKGEYYTSPVKINGVNNPFSALYNDFPSGTTFRLNAAELKQESSLGTGSQDGWMGRNAKLYVNSISNKAVARIMAYPVDLEGGGLSFLAAGTTNITFSNGKTMKFIVTGTNTNMNNYVKFVENFVYKNRNLSDYNFVKAALDELKANYTYDGHRDAFLTYIHRGGNCWGGNRLLVRLCVERGISARELGVTIPNWAAAHRVCIVNIGGVEYVADATPERSFVFTTLSKYKQDNKTYKLNDTYHEDIPSKW